MSLTHRLNRLEDLIPDRPRRRVFTATTVRELAGALLRGEIAGDDLGNCDYTTRNLVGQLSVLLVTFHPDHQRYLDATPGSRERWDQLMRAEFGDLYVPERRTLRRPDGDANDHGA
jgi:hypothetical protein